MKNSRGILLLKFNYLKIVLLLIAILSSLIVIELSQGFLFLLQSLMQFYENFDKIL